MTIPTIDLDPAEALSAAGVVDAATAGGQVDEEADWRGAIGALVLTAQPSEVRVVARSRRPYAHPLSERRRH